MKFQPRDKVQMTGDTYVVNRDARSYTGVVIGPSRLPNHVRIRRDGLKTVELWHESAWEPRDILNDGDTNDRAKE